MDIKEYYCYKIEPGTDPKGEKILKYIIVFCHTNDELNTNAAVIVDIISGENSGPLQLKNVTYVMNT